MIDRETAERIRLVVLDADGVLTDGGIYVADGIEGRSYQLRRFHVQDGLAVYMLRAAGIEPVIVSGRDSPALRERARELQIREVHQVHPFEKVGVVEGLLEDRGLGWTDAACLADDLADIGVMEKVGLPAAVANAVPEVKERARWESRAAGGEGAVREFAEALLRARGAWEGLVERYLAGGPVPGDEEP